MRLINADELPWHEVNIGGFVDTIVTPEDIDTMMIYKTRNSFSRRSEETDREAFYYE